MYSCFHLVMLSLLWSLVEVHSQTFPRLSFMSQTLANHAYVDLSLVGDDGSGSDSVQCITDLGTCCTSTQGPIHRGDWYFPDGNRLPFPGGGDIFEFRVSQGVDLRHRNNANSPTGIYRCDIPTNAVHDDTDISVRDTVYVGLYTANGGGISISGGVTFDPNQLTLTCISTGGPATTVTWTRDSTTFTQGNQTVLNDPVTAQYTHTLTVTTAGVYRCTVANNKPSSASASTTVAGSPSPTDVTAVQDGPTSITVIWTPPDPLDGITGYTISYTGGGSSGSETVSGGNTMSHILTGLTNGQTYTISIVATSSGLSSAPEQATVGLGPPPPTDVTAVQDGPTSITVIWTPPSPLGDTTGYRISFTGGSDVDIDGGSTNSHTLTGLTNGQTYTISIVATSEHLFSDATTFEITLLPAPGQVFVSVSSITATSISLSWSVSSGRVASWEVVWRPTDRGTESTSGPLSGTTYTILQLDPSTIYTLTVSATNVAGTTDSTPILFSTGATDVCQAESTSCECDNTSAIIGGVVAVAVVLIIATSLTVIVVVILRSRSGNYSAKTRATVGATVELSKLSEPTYVGPDQFHTTSNEAYNVVRGTGRTAEEIPQNLPPSTTSQQPTTTATGDYEPV